MKENLNYILEQIVKILIIFVIVLLIIGSIAAGKQFLIKMQSKVEPILDY